MYADDIVIFSSLNAFLQKRLDGLSKFCTKWCLGVNLSKTKVIIFNKPGRLLKEYFYFEKERIESFNNYKFLGLKFISSGLFKQGKEKLYKNHLKLYSNCKDLYHLPIQVFLLYYNIYMIIQ